MNKSTEPDGWNLAFRVLLTLTGFLLLLNVISLAPKHPEWADQFIAINIFIASMVIGAVDRATTR